MELKLANKPSSTHPSNWTEKSLLELANRSKDRFNDGDWIEAEFIESDGIRLVQTGNVGVGQFIDKDSKKYISEQSFSLLKCKQILPGDLLISRLAEPAGRACIFPKIDSEKSITSVDVTIFRPDESVVNRELLNQIFTTNDWLNAVRDNVGGTTHKRISRSRLGKLKVQIPPTLEEQKAIATALSDVDTLITNLDKLIAKKKAIKQGAMQRLLKSPAQGGQRLSGFEGEWVNIKLGDFADITKLAGFEYSNYFNSYKDGGEIIVIRGTNITNNKLDFSDVKTIPKSVSQFLKRSQLNAGDLVFAYVGTIGPVCLIEESGKYHLGPNTARITLSEKLDSLFVFNCFISPIIQKEIEFHTSTGAQPSLSMTKIRSFKLSVPPTMEEQKAISSILSDMENEIEELETKKSKYISIKQGMMQELLTGKTRLV